MEQCEMTRSEKLVGINFNVGGSEVDAIDQLVERRIEADEQGTLNSIKEQLLAEAEARIVDAQMWAVKAITYGA